MFSAPPVFHVTLKGSKLVFRGSKDPRNT